MKNVFNNVLDIVGNTPLVRLNSMTKGLECTTYAKVEFTNPGGSVKDRIALHIIDEAERTGAITGLWNPYNRTLKYPYDVQATQQSTLLNVSRSAVVEALSMYQDDRDKCIEVWSLYFTVGALGRVVPAGWGCRGAG